jgi:hypothetical protein
LDDIEEKKGLESSKPKSDKNSAGSMSAHGRNEGVSGTGYINAVPSGSSNLGRVGTAKSQQMVGGATDAWGR